MSQIEIIPFPHQVGLVRGGFCGRRGGVSTGPFESLNVSFHTPEDLPENRVENRRRIPVALVGQEMPIAMAHQVHGTRVLNVTQPSDALWTPGEEADALVTRVPGVFVGVTTADCVPVLVADGTHGVVAAVHCGWRSAFKGIAQEVVHAMEVLGADRTKLQAALGPSIQQPSYEVDQAFYDAFEAQDPASAATFFIAGRPGHFFFDLPAYVVHTFHAAGVPDVQTCDLDTFTQPDRFFSHRWAQKNTGGLRGTQLSLIGLMA